MLEELLTIDSVQDFLMDGTIYKELDAILATYQINSERSNELLDLADAVIDEKITVDQVPALIEQAFGVSKEVAIEIAIVLVGHRLLPLEAYVPGMEEQLQKWGADFETLPKKRFKKDPAVLTELFVDRIVKSEGLNLPAHLQKRIIYLTTGFLEKTRAKEATVELMKRPINLGGLELSEEAASHFLSVVEGEREAFVALQEKERGVDGQHATDEELASAVFETSVEERVGEVKEQISDRVEKSLDLDHISEEQELEVPEVVHTTDLQEEQLNEGDQERVSVEEEKRVEGVVSEKELTVEEIKKEDPISAALTEEPDIHHLDAFLKWVEKSDTEKLQKEERELEKDLLMFEEDQELYQGEDREQLMKEVKDDLAVLRKELEKRGVEPQESLISEELLTEEPEKENPQGEDAEIMRDTSGILDESIFGDSAEEDIEHMYQLAKNLQDDAPLVEEEAAEIGNAVDEPDMTVEDFLAWMDRIQDEVDIEENLEEPQEIRGTKQFSSVPEIKKEEYAAPDAKTMLLTDQLNGEFSTWVKESSIDVLRQELEALEEDIEGYRKLQTEDTMVHGELIKEVIQDIALIEEELELRGVDSHVEEESDVLEEKSFEEVPQDESPLKKETFVEGSEEFQDNENVQEIEEGELQVYQDHFPAVQGTHALTTEVPVISGEFISKEEKEELEQHAKALQSLGLQEPSEEEKAERKQQVNAALKPAIALFKKQGVDKQVFQSLASGFTRGRIESLRLEQTLREKHHFEEEDAVEIVHIFGKAKEIFEGGFGQKALAVSEEKSAQDDVIAKEKALLDKRRAVLTKQLSKEELSLTEQAQVSAARTKEEELNLQEKRLDQEALQEAEAASKPKKIRPKLSVASLPPDKDRVTDVVFKKTLMSPVDELRMMNLSEFRRLSADPAEAVRKIENRLALLQETSYEERIKGVRAWRDSAVNRLYITMAKEALAEGVSFAEVASNRRNAGQETLSPAEATAILSLNKRIKF